METPEPTDNATPELNKSLEHKLSLIKGQIGFVCILLAVASFWIIIRMARTEDGALMYPLVVTGIALGFLLGTYMRARSLCKEHPLPPSSQS